MDAAWLYHLLAIAALAFHSGVGALDSFTGTDTGLALRHDRQLLQASGSNANDSSGSGLIQDFVVRSGTHFMIQARNGSKDACETFYFAGANAYYLMARGADPETRSQVLEILDSAQSLGLKVLRMWAFGEGPLQYNSLQRYPGVYDEKVLVGLDFAINEASKRGIRVVLVFANYWAMYGGIDQYNIWSFEAGSGNCNGDATCRDDFYSDPVATGYYKDHVKKLLSRVNVFNGRLYREDPSIFGYNLMNEPRSQNELYVVQRITTDGTRPYNLSYNPGDDLQSWIEDMASYIKSIDPIHLLSTGQEGFAGNSTPLYMYSNPGAWASLLGVDFVRNNKAPGIDYATMHVYVDQWLCVTEGSTVAGQLEFLQTWIEARQQAGEEELEMPVVLEEFGSKLDVRAGQYQLAYDSCLADAKRQGSCAGVMFWDLTHTAYAPVDPWLDGILRFGGGYSNWLSNSTGQRGAVFDYVRNFSSAVEGLNAASVNSNLSSCVYVPPPQQGLGCKNLAVNLDEGGMPWTCLPGEPSNVNWCNSAGGADLYKNPPAAWRGAKQHALPYNSIEVLVLGNITNNGSTPINLKGAWIIIPFSMGVQTQFEGIWKRIADPNDYFKIYCWLITDSNGESLCDNGVNIAFTNFTWPVGVKRDRGLNITFTKDIMLPPGGWLGAESSGVNGANVAISFKDPKNNFRLDVSSLGLTGSLSCPEDPVYASWPPPPPPLPKPCTEGPDPRRGCPHLQWYWANQTAVGTPVAPSMPAAVPPVAAHAPAAAPAAAPGAGNAAGVLYTTSVAATPAQQGAVQTASITQGGRRHMLQSSPSPSSSYSPSSYSSPSPSTSGGGGGSTGGSNPPSGPASGTSNASPAPSQTGSSGSQTGQGTIPPVGAPNSPFSAGPFLRVLNTMAKTVPASSFNFTAGQQYIITTTVSLQGQLRKPRNITRPNGDPSANPHPDASGGKVAGVAEVLLTLQYTRTGLSGPTYKTLGQAQVVPNNGSSVIRGVFSFGTEDDTSGSAVVYVETAHPGMTISYTPPQVYLASSLANATAVSTIPAEVLDTYEPCVIEPDHGYTLVYNVTLPAGSKNDTLSVEMCSPGGYDQVLLVYRDGQIIARNDAQTPKIWNLTIPVQAGSRYLFVQEGSTGEPYGGYRGQPGLRLKWQSGQPFDGMYDAAPTTLNDTSFLRIDGNQLVIDCKRAAYVGVNTWDLMDKSRDLSARPEIEERLDAMVKAGWSVGRTWGFSLGSGVTDGALGTVIADPTKILETAPGVYNEEVFASLDWVIDQAAQRNLKLIIPIEDYWLSMDRYVNWSTTAMSKDDFYTDWQCRQMYKAHLKVFTHRKNTVNGRLYKEDPTIFYWDLMNEPRCTGCGFALQQWVEEMSVFMKAIDPNHLVTLGEEGFYSTTCERVFLNPGAGKRRTGISSSPWAAQEGQDFLANHVVPSIDLVTTHIWADNWMGYADFAGSGIDDDFDYTHGRDLWMEKLDYTRSWLSAHISDANAIGKPLIVEEFGKAVSAAKVYTGQLPHSLEPGETIEAGDSIRNIFMQAIYEQVSENLQSGGVAQGTNFWNLYSVGVGSDDPYQITLADTSTMAVIAAAQKNVSVIAGTSEGATCSPTHSDSDAVPFPGYMPGNWTTPPGPPAPDVGSTGFTPLGAGGPSPGSGSSSGSASPSPSSYSPSSSSPSPSSPGTQG